MTRKHKDRTFYEWACDLTTVVLFGSIGTAVILLLFGVLLGMIFVNGCVRDTAYFWRNW